jgi:DNA-binding NarL/FixJ family response regulator
MAPTDIAREPVKSGRTRVLLADDHTIVREGLLSLLNEQPDLNVVGTAENGLEAVEKARQTFPDVVVMDVAMPLLNGIEATRQLRQLLPRTNVIILTMYADDAYVLRALQAGVRGYLLKKAAAAELVRAVHAVERGTLYLSKDISQTVVERYLSSEHPAEEEEETLSNRERQILQLVAEGHTNREIASALGITPKTVDTHRTRLMAKLDIHDTPGLVRYAIRKGMVRADP